MTTLRQRMREDMQVRGLAPRTQTSYLQAVRQLTVHYRKPPDQISEDELRQYFLYLRNEKRAARTTCTVALCAFPFLFEHTLHRPWPILTFVRPPRVQPLPVVLRVDDVRQVLHCVRVPQYCVCLSTIYACGLRVQEGVTLNVPQIDSARLQLHVRGGKAGKDRYVPLPHCTLLLLRAHWCTHRLLIGCSPPAHPCCTAYRSWPPVPCPCAVFSRRFASPSPRADYTSMQPCTPYGTPGRPTCWKRASISASFKPGLATPPHVPRRSIPISPVLPNAWQPTRSITSWRV